MDLIGLVLFVIGGAIWEEAWRKREYLPPEFTRAMGSGGFVLILTAVIIWMYL
jgi:hypothetical protein